MCHGNVHIPPAHAHGCRKHVGVLQLLAPIGGPLEARIKHRKEKKKRIAVQEESAPLGNSAKTNMTEPSQRSAHLARKALGLFLETRRPNKLVIQPSAQTGKDCGRLVPLSWTPDPRKGNLVNSPGSDGSQLRGPIRTRWAVR